MVLVAKFIVLGNAGTAMRPLAAVLCAGIGTRRLEGSARMHERPIAELVTALQQVHIPLAPLLMLMLPSWEQIYLAHLVAALRLPYKPHLYLVRKSTAPGSANASIGGLITTTASTSSQFITSLLLVAPLCSNTTTITISGNIISAPYIRMTTELMKQFGISLSCSVNATSTSYVISPGKYISPTVIDVEGDASSSSYLLAAAVLCNAYHNSNSTIHVLGCGDSSLQGDIQFASALRRMGVNITTTATTMKVTPGGSLQPLDLDCVAIPDAAMTLAVIASTIPGTLRMIY